jgi:glycerophosphoryl diester phosphodiesterase
MAQALIRVGHKGADAIAPGNTEPSFQAALELGVDMIEFDVLCLEDGRLVLAHDFGDAARRQPLTLDEGLDVLAGGAYGGVELDVDLKQPGYEAEVVAALADRGLDGRALISSAFPQSLARIGEVAPGLRRGWSVPRVRRDYTQSLVWMLPALAAARWIRAGLPAKAERALRRGECEAFMVHRLLVSRLLAARIHAAGGALYVWTVDDAAAIARFERLGADAVITNDPRLFDQLGEASR